MTFLRNILLQILVTFCLFSGNSAVALEIAQPEEFIYEGKIIDSIVIENRNIYDTKQKKYNKFIFKMANNIHQTTQKKIIERAVLLKKGEPYAEQLAEETARILRLRFVLFDAWLVKEIYDNDKLLIRVVTIDQWSLAIGADFKREGNEHNIKIGASEKNLFGQNRQISFHYTDQSDDDSYSQASFSEDRLFGQKLKGLFKYSTNPLEKYTLFYLMKPYYDLNQKFGFLVSLRFNEGRTDYYLNDSLTAQSFYKGDKTESELFYRFGSYNVKYLMQLKHVYNYEKTNSDVSESVTAQDSLYHAVITSVKYSHYDYKKKYNIDGFNYTEDFNQGKQINLSFQNTYSPHISKMLYEIVEINLLKNYITHNSLLTCQSLNTYWFDSSGKIRTRIGLNFKYYNQSIDKFTLACNADYRLDESRLTNDLLTLGGTTGIRGADKYFLTGDRRFILNTEIRFAPRFSILSLNIGGLIFSDFGNISHVGEELKLSNTHLSYGIGLRLAFDKSTKNIIRIDFAYSKNNGWQLSFGGGQYFRAKEMI